MSSSTSNSNSGGSDRIYRLSLQAQARQDLSQLGFLWHEYNLLAAMGAAGSVSTLAVRTALEALRNSVARLRPRERNLFLNHHEYELGRTKEAVSVIARGGSSGLSNDEKQLWRRLRDEVFMRLLQMPADAGIREPHAVTRLFRRFIEGITFFADQPAAAASARWINHPVYHRAASCGDGGSRRCAFGAGGQPRELNEATKKIVETCYVERLIYDHMWRTLSLHTPAGWNAEPEQDERHTVAVNLSQANYESCFPGARITVYIEYRNIDGGAKVPVALTVSRIVGWRQMKVEKAERIDRYVREWVNDSYWSYVTCYRSTGGRQYYKSQDFEHERPWVAVPGTKRSGSQASDPAPHHVSASLGPESPSTTVSRSRSSRF